MSGVHIDRLREREGDVIVIQSFVDSCEVEISERGLRQSCHELLHVSEALRGRCRVPRTKTVPELEIYLI